MSKINKVIEVESAEYTGKSRKFLPQEVVHQLSSVNPYISLSYVFLQWILIIIAIYVSVYFWDSPYNFIVYVLSVIWIGSRQHALAYLMHEGSHYFFLPKQRHINDIFCELFIAWPLLLSVRNYRIQHFAHHRYTNTDNDPSWTRKNKSQEWIFPQTWPSLIIIFVKNLLIFSSAFFANNNSNNKLIKNKSIKSFLFGQIIYYCLTASIIIYFKLWLIVGLYWIIPYLTWLKITSRLRGIAEHSALEYNHPLRQTRTTTTNLIEKLLIAPVNLNYHLEHHLYPSVPFYNLDKIHQQLMHLEEFRTKAHITQGYFRVLQECVNYNNSLYSSSQSK